MLRVARNQQIIAGLELHGIALGKFKAGRSLEQQHPFILRLIIPEVRRAGEAV